MEKQHTEILLKQILNIHKPKCIVTNSVCERLVLIQTVTFLEWSWASLFLQYKIPGQHQKRDLWTSTKIQNCNACTNIYFTRKISVSKSGKPV
ncbi:hypothetical protein XELAEV_18041217mg [Xenopus laevis]|uniref:Uncharacterized protein n=1 Tax=Xenopus laevis TaxID=8355 RepID=A0A974C217_XENLA|nr:hypothetical protein XELAEV_18041217mg [Xenopus laevis]